MKVKLIINSPFMATSLSIMVDKAVVTQDIELLRKTFINFTDNTYKLSAHSTSKVYIYSIIIFQMPLCPTA